MVTLFVLYGTGSGSMRYTTARQGYTSIEDFRGKLKPYDRNRASKSIPAVLSPTAKAGDSDSSDGAAVAKYVQMIAFLCVVIVAMLAERLYGPF